ncbi:twin-arginine translocase subunit TatC [Candidatus Saccharibacteria bacterium]|nr:twin-arginine translocase subunit TatC [Candidatus Saccharibacteria bacterium]
MQGGTSAKAQPFSEHVRELRRRLIYVVATLFLGSIVGYAIHGSLFRLIKRPLREQLYYTTPLGGFNAMIKISILFGLIITVPVFIYQLGKFLGPAFRHRIRPPRIVFFSIILAAAGVLFAYFVGLPASLHFLANVDSQDLQSIITVNEYLNFVAAYSAGFAILFQLPLILLFINRIKPQKPGRLMRIQRWVVLFSFIVAAILTPTPDPINQIIMALPIILLYQFSIALIWFVNRREKRFVVEPVLIAPTPASVPSSLPQAPTAVSARKPQLIMDIIGVSQTSP